MPTSSSDRLNQIGNEYFGRGLYTGAYDYYQQALACDRQSGDRRALVATLGNLGNVCAVSGRREQAQQYYQEVLELQKVLGDERGIGTTLANLGNLRTDAGEWGRAQAYYLEALDLLERVVAIDRKYHLAKLEENTRRLEALRERVAPHPSRFPSGERGG